MIDALDIRANAVWERIRDPHYYERTPAVPLSCRALEATGERGVWCDIAQTVVTPDAARAARMRAAIGKRGDGRAWKDTDARKVYAREWMRRKRAQRKAA